VLQEIKAFRSIRGVVSRVGKEQVADTDLSRLDPGGTLHWLNDEIINFYGALIMERSERFASNKENLLNGTIKKRKGKVEHLNVHYFSTFFWPKIEKSYKDTRLNKWTKKVRLS
jgi:sentrin-specific protease 1